MLLSDYALFLTWKGHSLERDSILFLSSPKDCCKSSNGSKLWNQIHIVQPTNFHSVFSDGHLLGTLVHTSKSTLN